MTLSSSKRHLFWRQGVLRCPNFAALRQIFMIWRPENLSNSTPFLECIVVDLLRPERRLGSSLTWKLGVSWALRNTTRISTSEAFNWTPQFNFSYVLLEFSIKTLPKGLLEYHMTSHVIARTGIFSKNSVLAFIRCWIISFDINFVLWSLT